MAAADLTDEVPVVIAGAGPAGLVAAITLARNGIGSLRVERNPGLSPLPRATAVSTRTMELLRSWGLGEEVRAGQLTIDSTGAWAAETLASSEGRGGAAGDRRPRGDRERQPGHTRRRAPGPPGAGAAPPPGDPSGWLRSGSAPSCSLSTRPRLAPRHHHRGHPRHPVPNDRPHPGPRDRRRPADRPLAHRPGRPASHPGRGRDGMVQPPGGTVG